MLICPICKKELSKKDNSYICLNNHTFDISKKGYVNFLSNHPNSGDNKDMVNARFDFLNNGYYLPLKEEITKIIASFNPNTVLDLGCGVGYYTNELKTNVYGIDISKDAIAKASQYKDNHYFVSQANNLPFTDNSFDVILSIFSPIFSNELYRVSKDNGIIIIVTPKSHHLIELKELLYDNPYLNSDKKVSIEGFKLINEIELRYQKDIPYLDIINLLKMTPYFYKTSKSDLDKLSTNLLITMHFNIAIYKK